MRLEVLLSGLENAQPSVRIDVVRVLGMVDETRALPTLRARYPLEPDAGVKDVIGWAGQRIYLAEQAGYSTTEEVFRYFRVADELGNVPDENERRLLQKLQDDLDRDLRDMQSKAGKHQVGLALAAGLGGAVVGGPLVGMGAMAGTMMAGMRRVGSNMGRAEGSAERTPAMAPSDANIDVWVRRLRAEPDPRQRLDACIELAQLNNPRALPHLAWAFIEDPSEHVRDAAQRFGKILYWNAVYWEMTQDGSLLEEMQRRAAAAGKRLSPDQAASAKPDALPPDSGAPGQALDVSEILRKAERGRQARKRKPL